MKAIIYTKYGFPEVLQLKETEKPSPKDNEVLVKVHAASVNSWDWDLLRGKPYLYRLLFGLFRPKNKTIGCDIAGHVEEVGNKVSLFKTGDEVFGDISACGFGAFAEYVKVTENVLALKPVNLSFIEAATVPQAAILALQGLRDIGKIDKGKKVLINGAGGGVGTFGLQLAKLYGCEVTCVDHEAKLKMLQTMGADHLIDYKLDNYTQNGRKYDLILEMVANRSVFAYRRALSPGGIFVMVGGTVATILSTLFIGSLLSLIGRRKLLILAHKPNPKDLNYLKEIIEEGKIVPVIDKIYSLNQVPEALHNFGEGNVKGKLVIDLEII